MTIGHVRSHSAGRGFSRRGLGREERRPRRIPHRVVAFLAATLPVLSAGAAKADGDLLPVGVSRQLPPSYVVLMAKSGDLTGDGRADWVVALARPADAAYASGGGDDGDPLPEPTKRPLLVFVGERGGGFRLAGRNDEVVANLASYWQCDPFLSSSDGLSLKGRYFTVENAAACGTHWSDYVTFRYDAGRRAFLLSSEIHQDWTFNPKASTDGDADALTRDVDVVTKPDPRRPVAFSDYVPK